MSSLPELLSLIDRLYEGALDATHWQAAITSICRAFGGEAALLAVQDAHSKDVEEISFVDIDQNYQSSYAGLSRLADMRSAFLALVDNTALGALTGAAIARAAPDFERSRFHDEWLKPQRVLDYVAAPLVPSPSLIGALYIGRSRHKNGYQEEDLANVRALRPHLLRALQVRQRLEQANVVARAALATSTASARACFWSAPML